MAVTWVVSASYSPASPTPGQGVDQNLQVSFAFNSDSIDVDAFVDAFTADAEWMTGFDYGPDFEGFRQRLRAAALAASNAGTLEANDLFNFRLCTLEPIGQAVPGGHSFTVTVRPPGEAAKTATITWDVGPGGVNEVPTVNQVGAQQITAPDSVLGEISSLDFGDGNASRYYRIPSTADLTLQDGDWAVAFLVRVQENSGTAYQYVLSNGALGATGSLNVNLGEDSTGSGGLTWNFNAADVNGVTHDVQGETEYGANDTNTLIVVQRSGDDLQLWVCEQGSAPVLDTAESDASFAGLGQGPWFVGCRADLNTGRFYEEHLGMLTIIPQAALNASEIRLLAERQSPGALGQTAYWWAFGGPDTAVPERSGSNHAAVRNGSGWPIASGFALNPIAAINELTGANLARSAQTDAFGNVNGSFTEPTADNLATAAQGSASDSVPGFYGTTEQTWLSNPPSPPAADVTVSSISALNTAISNSSPGDVIALTPGNYSELSVTSINRNPAITIRGSDPANRPRLALSVSSSHGVVFNNLEVYRAAGGSNVWIMTGTCSNIALEDSILRSDYPLTGGGGLQGNTPDGLNVTSSCDNLRISRCEIKWLNDCIVLRGDGIIIEHNLIRDFISDACKTSFDISNFTYRWNFGTRSLNTDDEPGIHGDFCQLFINNATQVINGVTIIGNVMASPDTVRPNPNGLMQGPFLNTHDMRNVTVKGNVISGRMGNALQIYQSVANTVIIGNTFVQSFMSANNTARSVSGLNLGGSGYTIKNNFADQLRDPPDGFVDQNNDFLGIGGGSVSQSQLNAAYAERFEGPGFASVSDPLSTYKLKAGGPLDQAVKIGAVGSGYVDWSARTLNTSME